MREVIIRLKMNNSKITDLLCDLDDMEGHQELGKNYDFPLTIDTKNFLSIEVLKHVDDS